MTRPAVLSLPPSPAPRRWRWLAVLSMTCVLAACGEPTLERDGDEGDATTAPDSNGGEADAHEADAHEPEGVDASAPPRDARADGATTDASGADATSGDTGNTTSTPGVWTEMLEAINAARASARMCGTDMMPAVPPLAWNAQLAAAALGHSEHMATLPCFSHDMTGTQPCANGTMCQRIVAAGYRWSRIGENIAAGQRSVAQVMSGWLSSPGHCRNIMSANFREVGAGLVMGGRLGYYWTQNFGTPGSATTCR